MVILVPLLICRSINMTSEQCQQDQAANVIDRTMIAPQSGMANAINLTETIEYTLAFATIEDEDLIEQTQDDVRHCSLLGQT
jgi:hypothetical protein